MSGLADQKPIGSSFGAKSTAAEVVAGLDLSGKTAVVTGGYSGIGLETTRALAGAGAHVIVPARSPEKAEAALGEIEGAVEMAEMDLADLGSVHRFGEDVVASKRPVSILINNAGIMACPETRIGREEWEAQFAVNHLGHFALAEALEPALLRAEGARVVALSSLAHKRSDIRWEDVHFRKEPYEKWAAYGQSKTANSLFALALDGRLKEKGVRAFAVHPGGIFTPLQRHLPREEMVALGWLDDTGAVSAEAARHFKTPPQGAATTVWCAVSPEAEGLGGVYCEDCDVARLADEDSPRHAHVAPWAVDPESAARLWSLSEEMLEAA